VYRSPPAPGCLGKLKLADGGTVFLDEVGDVSLFAQAKLLRAIEDRSMLADPNVVTAAEVDRLISRAGAATVSEYFDRVRGAAAIGAVKVVIDEPSPPPVSPRPLPVAAAILVRDATVSIRALLAESRAVRDQLENMGLGAPEGGLSRRRDLLVVWVLPAAVFDDADWPGGQPVAPPNALRDARRAAAGQWLADQGIGLAAVG
jgi:hypothetical protein